MQSKVEDLKQVSYLEIDTFDGRSIPLQPCYLGKDKWEAWFPLEDGSTQSLPINGMSDGCYFSKEKAQKTDLYIGFIDLILKRAYYNDIVHFEKGIFEDISNLATSITKINLFHELWREDKSKINRRFVTTELEYIFKVCRSLFDLLQEVISKIWKRFQYLDTKKETKQLKAAFSKMVLFNNKLSDSEKIMKRFLIPEPLADFYVRNGVFFNWLRSYRDKITHGGSNIGLYILDEGFAVPTNIEPFKDLPIWEYTEIKANDLGSLRAVVAYAVLNTLHSLEDFSTVIQQIMELPKDISPSHKIFVTGHSLGILGELHTYCEGEEWIKI